MAIDKALYAAPQGLEALDEMNQAQPELEIEIEDPESVTIGIDGMPILEIEAGEEVGLATVYRVLTQFESAGLVMRHRFEGGLGTGLPSARKRFPSAR